MSSDSVPTSVAPCSWDDIKGLPQRAFTFAYITHNINYTVLIMVLKTTQNVSEVVLVREFYCPKTGCQRFGQRNGKYLQRIFVNSKILSYLVKFYIMVSNLTHRRDCLLMQCLLIDPHSKRNYVRTCSAVLDLSLSHGGFNYLVSINE